MANLKQLTRNLFRFINAQADIIIVPIFKESAENLCLLYFYFIQSIFVLLKKLF